MTYPSPAIEGGPPEDLDVSVIGPRFDGSTRLVETLSHSRDVYWWYFLGLFSKSAGDFQESREGKFNEVSSSVCPLIIKYREGGVGWEKQGVGHPFYAQKRVVQVKIKMHYIKGVSDFCASMGLAHV